MRIGLGIPTYGRSAIVSETVRDIARQTRRPERIVVCAARPEDMPHAGGPVECLLADIGLPRQRNRIVDALDDCDVVLFLDDDFLMHPGYIAAMERLFEARPSLVVATGTVLADGVGDKGLSFGEARRILAADPGCADPLRVAPVANGYGCNMAIRLSVLRATGLRFDERLPLYAWQEDADLSCRLAPHGDILRLDGARGVHLGVKAGRSPGVPLGYSQVINPLYIAQHAPAYTMRRAVAQIGRNVVANLLRALRPEPWVDRRGRVQGNVLGLLDALRGRLTPERAIELQAALSRRAAPAGAYAIGYRDTAMPVDGRAVRYQQAPPVR
jgi:GT2 family glycosyltransferase